MPRRTPRPAIDPKWIRNPSDELAASLGHTFNEAAGRRVCEFIERYCRQSKGKWAGKPLTLLAWQRDFLMRLFGWKAPDGTRRFKRAYLEVAKKNGKSTLLSAIVLYLLLADGEGGPEVYLNACDRDQASIIFKEAAAMVGASDGLKSRLKVIDYRKRMLVRDRSGNPTGGELVTNSGEVEKQDGLNPHGTIFDELHRQKKRHLWDIFEYASVAREQPVKISITTAGEDTEGVWYEQREYSEQVNAGIIPDVTHLGVVYRADEADDIDDPATWRKANPSLGETIKEADFKRDLAEAKQNPVKLALFRRLRLNIITRTEARFLEAGLWDGCKSELVYRSGDPCHLGLDLSATTDLTALAAVFEIDGEIDAHFKFWIPEANIPLLERRDRQPYALWVKAGLIQATPGNAVDYSFVRAEIKRMSRRFDVRSIGIDPWQARQLAQQLQEEDGLAVVLVRQGFATLSDPTKELLRLVLSRTIHHDGHAVAAWNAGNAIAVEDAAGNLKLDKARSRQKIDGLAALVTALAARTGDPERGESGGSVYNTRGIQTV